MRQQQQRLLTFYVIILGWVSAMALAICFDYIRDLYGALSISLFKYRIHYNPRSDYPIVLSILIRFTAFDYPFGIFKLFFFQ